MHAAVGYIEAVGARDVPSYVAGVHNNEVELEVIDEPPPEGWLHFLPPQQHSVNLNFSFEESSSSVEEVNGEYREVREDLHGMICCLEDVILGE